MKQNSFMCKVKQHGLNQTNQRGENISFVIREILELAC